MRVKTATTAANRVGGQTIRFRTPPVAVAAAGVAGPVEGAGPLGHTFDEVKTDSLLGQPTWEAAERLLFQEAVERAVGKAGLKADDIDLLLGGDLLDQLLATNFAARELDIPLFGLFAACSTFTEALTLGAMAVDGGYAERVAVAVSSHHDSVERQMRFPTEFGYQRPLTSTWTATGAAAVILARDGEGPVLTMATPGRVIDMGVSDPFDMGAAMAPAAADTIRAHLTDTGRQPEDYDLILTGDLSRVGAPLLDEILRQDHQLAIADRHQDCGILLYDPERHDVHAGGSGTACSGLVTAGHVYEQLQRGKLKRVLLVATGALLSPTSYQQGESIPCIAHAVVLEAQGVV